MSKATDLLDAVIGSRLGGEVREGQRQMTLAVETAIRDREHLLCQAGTGTGKSLGYLVPALAQGRRVVVSTGTKALQDQLVRTDLPWLVAAVAPHLGHEPTFAVLKGRENFVCRNSLSDAMRDSVVGFKDEISDGVQAVADWVDHGGTGDRVDLPDPVSGKAWAKVARSGQDCPGARKCDFGADCFSELAKEAAREADIVVVNHALLAIDAASGGNVLPEHDIVVVDEGHELTSFTTSALSGTYRPGQYKAMSTLAKGTISDGIVDKSAIALQNLDDVVRSMPEGRIATLPNNFALAARAAIIALAPVHRDAREDAADDNAKVTRKKMIRNRYGAVMETLTRLLDQSADDVLYVEADGDAKLLKVAPLDVAPFLARNLFAFRTVVLTSATLAPGGDFVLLAETIGIAGHAADAVAAEINDKRTAQPAQPAVSPDSGPAADPERDVREFTLRPWKSLEVETPFDYDKQAILYLATDLPLPVGAKRAEHLAAVVDLLVEVVQAANGRTLGLFTSVSAAKKAAEQLADRVDVTVLVQDGSQPVGTLVEKFKNDHHAVLLGVDSLWQGVSVEGGSCAAVVIEKISFPRPDEPIAQARTEAADKAGRSGFAEVSLSHAAIRLAQGAGRLIRTRTDRGVVIICDPRVQTKSYGRFLLAGLPPMRRLDDRAVVLGALTRLAVDLDEQLANEPPPPPDSKVVPNASAVRPGSAGPQPCSCDTGPDGIDGAGLIVAYGGAKIAAHRSRTPGPISALRSAICTGCDGVFFGDFRLDDDRTESEPQLDFAT